MGPKNMATQIDGIGVIHLTIAIRPEIKVFDIKMMVKSNAIIISFKPWVRFGSTS